MLTDKSKRPVLLKGARIAGFSGLAFATSAVFITSVGAVLAYSTIPFAAVFVAVAPTKSEFLIYGAAAIYSVLMLTFLYFAGRSYINFTSRLAFRYRQETLVPLFSVSLICWIPLIAIVAIANSTNIGSSVVTFGLILSLFAQGMETKKLRKLMSNHIASDTTLQLEPATVNT